MNMNSSRCAAKASKYGVSIHTKSVTTSQFSQFQSQPSQALPRPQPPPSSPAVPQSLTATSTNADNTFSSFPTIFLGNIPPNVSHATLLSTVRRFGLVLQLHYNPCPRQWCCARIVYNSAPCADRAVIAFHGKRAFENTEFHRLVSCHCAGENGSLGDSGGVGGTADQSPSEFDKRKTFSLLRDGPPGANLFVYGIPSIWTEIQLMELMAPYGHIVGVRVPQAQKGSKNLNKGFGFVSYDSQVAAIKAFRDLMDVVISGKQLRLQLKNGEEHLLPPDLRAKVCNQKKQSPAPLPDDPACPHLCSSAASQSLNTNKVSPTTLPNVSYPSDQCRTVSHSASTPAGSILTESTAVSVNINKTIIDLHGCPGDSSKCGSPSVPSPPAQSFSLSASSRIPEIPCAQSFTASPKPLSSYPATALPYSGGKFCSDKFDSAHRQQQRIPSASPTKRSMMSQISLRESQSERAEKFVFQSPPTSIQNCVQLLNSLSNSQLGVSRSQLLQYQSQIQACDRKNQKQSFSHSLLNTIKKPLQERTTEATGPISLGGGYHPLRQATKASDAKILEVFLPRQINSFDAFASQHIAGECDISFNDIAMDCQAEKILRYGESESENLSVARNCVDDTEKYIQPYQQYPRQLCVDNEIRQQKAFFATSLKDMRLEDGKNDTFRSGFQSSGAVSSFGGRDQDTRGIEPPTPDLIISGPSSVESMHTSLLVPQVHVECDGSICHSALESLRPCESTDPCSASFPLPFAVANSPEWMVPEKLCSKAYDMEVNYKSTNPVTTLAHPVPISSKYVHADDQGPLSFTSSACSPLKVGQNISIKANGMKYSTSYPTDALVTGSAIEADDFIASSDVTCNGVNHTEKCEEDSRGEERRISVGDISWYGFEFAPEMTTSDVDRGSYTSFPNTGTNFDGLWRALDSYSQNGAMVGANVDWSNLGRVIGSIDMSSIAGSGTAEIDSSNSPQDSASDLAKFTARILSGSDDDWKVSNCLKDVSDQSTEIEEAVFNGEHTLLKNNGSKYCNDEGDINGIPRADFQRGGSTRPYSPLPGPLNPCTLMSSMSCDTVIPPIGLLSFPPLSISGSVAIAGTAACGSGSSDSSSMGRIESTESKGTFAGLDNDMFQLQDKVALKSPPEATAKSLIWNFPLKCQLSDPLSLSSVEKFRSSPSSLYSGDQRLQNATQSLRMEGHEISELKLPEGEDSLLPPAANELIESGARSSKVVASENALEVSQSTGLSLLDENSQESELHLSIMHAGAESGYGGVICKDVSQRTPCYHTSSSMPA